MANKCRAHGFNSLAVSKHAKIQLVYDDSPSLILLGIALLTLVYFPIVWSMLTKDASAMKKLSALIMLLLIALIVVYAGSPYYTAYQLKNAYDAKDGTTIAAAIDYEQLRPRLKTQLSSKFANTMQQYPLVAELGGTALTKAAEGFITESVDGAITEQNIQRLIQTQGQANQATKELAAAWAIASNQVDLQGLIQQLILQRGDVNAVIKSQIEQMMDNQAAELQANAAKGEDSAKPTLSYCGLNCFTLSGQVKGYPLTIEMQRQGLIGWKIIDVVLP